jgi:hypothetical protein
VPTHSPERRRLARLNDGLALAGHGWYLVGSVLYVAEAPTLAAWSFVVGSVAALVAGILPQLVRLWIQEREGEDDGSVPTSSPGALRVRGAWAS